MIQRLQTLFLLVFCGVSAGNFFLFPVELSLLNTAFGAQAAVLNQLPLVFTLIIFLNIFLYNRRMRQIRVNQVVWVLFSFYWGALVYFIVQTNQHFSPYLPDLGLAFVGEAMLLLANKYIKKDEALIRSIDRLR